MRFGVFFYTYREHLTKVWHNSTIFKLTQNGISENLLSLLHDLCSSRRQCVVPKGQVSAWMNVTAGVLLGSIIGSLLFLICINDLSEKGPINPTLCEKDTSLFSVIHDR